MADMPTKTKALIALSGIVALAIGVMIFWPRPSNGGGKGKIENEWGTFPSPAIIQLVGGSRDVKLLDDFVYIDASRKIWTAPKNSIVNGASIPQAFWSFMGGPFEGEYRNASIVHDTECDLKQNPWHQVHRMFYEACLCGGVSETKAKVMYYAVYHFGPRWGEREVPVFEMTAQSDGSMKQTKVVRKVSEAASTDNTVSKEDVKKIMDFIEKNNPEIEDLEKRKID